MLPTEFYARLAHWLIVGLILAFAVMVLTGLGILPSFTF